MKTISKLKKVFLVIPLIFMCFLVTACLDKPKPYIITQYGDDQGNQSMFYTIVTPNKELIIIDGGWTNDSAKVKEVIVENGGIVNAWILTHPHSDHIGAFTEIFADPDTIAIEQIYAMKIDHEWYTKNAQPAEGVDVYKRFIQLTKDCDNLQYLYENDIIDLYGLKLEVLHSGSGRQGLNANASSLLFTITGKKQTMMFTGDVSPAMSDQIIKNHKDKLKADFIQMAHHGNFGLTKEFYALVNPKAAFFDAPKWLREPVDEKLYDTAEYMRFMEILGAEIYTFATAPNVVYLY